MEKTKQQLYEVIERDKNELFEILSSLIKINSESFASYGNEEECAKFLEGIFKDIGCETDLYSPLSIPNFEEHPDYLFGRELKNRLNCTGVIPGKSHGKKLMLAAHIDTVQIGNESNWSFPPLSGEVKDGKIFGRGSCDDKYGLAAMIFIVKKMKELRIQLDYDLFLTGYCDEEYGGGNGSLAAALKYPCDDYLNLDGREYEIWESGIGGGELNFGINTKNPVNNCSNAYKGINLVVSELEKFRERRMEEIDATPSFEGSVIVKDAVRIMNVSVGSSGGTDMGRGIIFITYYTNKAEKEINEELDMIKENVKEKFEELDLLPLEITKRTRFFHYVKAEQNNPITALVKKCGEENGLNLNVVGACLSDLPMFKLYGSPRSISFGMGAAFSREGGSHQANEYMECDKLVAYTKTLAGVMLEY